jgi:hypothetical protein
LYNNQQQLPHYQPAHAQQQLQPAHVQEQQTVRGQQLQHYQSAHAQQLQLQTTRGQQLYAQQLPEQPTVRSLQHYQPAYAHQQLIVIRFEGQWRQQQEQRTVYHIYSSHQQQLAASEQPYLRAQLSSVPPQIAFQPTQAPRSLNPKPLNRKNWPYVCTKLKTKTRFFLTMLFLPDIRLIQKPYTGYPVRAE